LNVSRTGLFIPTEKFLPMGAVVSLDIALPEGGPKIRAIARVAYVLDAAKARETSRVPGMGMEFLDVGGVPFADQITTYLDEKVNSASEQRRRKPRATVLVIDDSAVQRMLAIQCLRASGYEVLVAVDGLDGLGVAIRERPDLILSDVNMPRMDGWQLLRMLRARPNLANTPLIFLTTESNDISRLKGYRLGVDDFLSKPFQGAELVARVERVLNRSRAQAGAGGNRALRGDLSQVGLASVLSLAEMERRTGSLLLVREDETVTLLLREGAVVRIDLPARHADKRGIERFFHALDWTQGQFELSAIEVDAEDELELPISFVLLEHARRQDEAQQR
jgi:DNA-binding response OmpR family regulator/Tfp pilus assembly protein PilZ